MKFSTCLTPSWIKEWYNQKKQGFLTQTRISPHSPGRIISSPQTHLTSYHKNHKVIKSNHQHLCHKQGLRTTIPPPMIITPYQLPHKTSNSASFLPEPEMVPCDHWHVWSASVATCGPQGLLFRHHMHIRIPQKLPQDLYPTHSRLRFQKIHCFCPDFPKTIPNCCPGHTFTHQSPHLHNPRLLCQDLHPQQNHCHPPRCSGMTSHQTVSLLHICSSKHSPLL